MAAAAVGAARRLGRRERLIVAALRCWGRSRALRRAPMPLLFRLLAPLGAGMLVVSLNGFFALAEAEQRRPLQVGRAGVQALTGDEAAVLMLLHAAGAASSPAPAPDGSSGQPLLKLAAQITRRQVAELG